MEEKTTKEKIFDVSLELFSQNGFNNTSIRQIAKEVGIRESSIYNHYNSKQAILDDILNTFSEFFENNEGIDPKEDPLLEENPELFYHMGSKGFRQLIKNEKIMKIFRLFFIQMYHDEQIAEYFHQHLIDEPLEFWTFVFKKLMDKGIIKKLDPKDLARSYYGYTMFLLFELFIQKNSFPDDELDKVFDEAERHAFFLLESVRI